MPSRLSSININYITHVDYLEKSIKDSGRTSSADPPLLFQQGEFYQENEAPIEKYCKGQPGISGQGLYFRSQVDQRPTKSFETF